MRDAISAFRDRGETEFTFTRLFHEGGMPPSISEASARSVLAMMERVEENALMFRDDHISLI